MIFIFFFLKKTAMPGGLLSFLLTFVQVNLHQCHEHTKDTQGRVFDPDGWGIRGVYRM